jgi:hypothetical protein
MISYTMALFAALWVSVAGVAALAGHATSAHDWAVLALCAGLPPLVMARYSLDHSRDTQAPSRATVAPAQKRSLVQYRMS